MFSIFDVAPFIGYTITQNVLIYAIAGGVFLAFFAYWFVQTFNGGIVRSLLKKGTGKENGATLKELGKDKFIYKWLLRNGSTLRNLVSCDCGELAEIKKNRSADAEMAEEAKDDDVAESKEEASDKKEKPAFKDRVKSFFYDFRIKRYDYEGVKFFISEENKEKARGRHSKPVSPLWLPIALVMCALCAFGMTYLLPIIMEFIRG